MKKKFQLAGMGIVPVVGLIAGIILIIKPDMALKFAIKLIGWSMIVSGVYQMVVTYLSGVRDINAYVKDGCIAVAGLAMLLFGLLVIHLIPLCIGAALLISAVYKMMAAMNMRNRCMGNWMPMLVMAAFSAAFALFLIFYSGAFTHTILRIVGVLLLVECSEDLFAINIFK